MGKGFSMTDVLGSKVSRRALVRGSVAAGFALAVQPIAEGTIITDTKGLTAGMVKFKAPDGVQVPAYRAFPTKGTGMPVVLVIQEIFGVHEHIKDVCRRFAKLGYYAIAPELYFRQGDVSQIKDFQVIIRDVVSKVPDRQVMTDLDAALAYAKTTGKADVTRAAVTGFCWGGRITWLYAAHNPSLKAGAAWYGNLVKGSVPGVKNPVDVAPTLTVPVVGFYGGKDAGISQESITEMRAALAKGKSGSVINVYADAGHGFNADYRPSYDEKDAKDAFVKLQAWFKQRGVV
ncbi:MAG: dienelactone hydrolase family protein [Cytophagales bacterium]|nr:dienelactone hydrolase family protein [Armatimonadota bacterium]